MNRIRLWLRFLLMVILTILYVVGEWMIALLMMALSLPMVLWSHLKALWRETFLQDV